MIKKIGVLTSGGDAPGMNAAIRGVVRAALGEGFEVYGIYEGYRGLYEDNIEKLDRRSVSEVINRGGTMLGSARFPEFKEKAVMAKSIDNLKKHGIEALVVIGGDGSYRGAMELTEMGYPCIGIPGTIDNDVPGTDYTVGYLTALNCIIAAVDRLRDTSGSHSRISVVEVMGRFCGDLTVAASIAGGAEYAIIPENPYDEQALIDDVAKGIDSGKRHSIILVTEHITDVHELSKKIEVRTGRETRATVLGHVQRGGSPTAFDRILASRMGVFAVDLLAQGLGGRCIGIIDDKLVQHDIIDAIENKPHPFNKDLFKLSQRLF